MNKLFIILFCLLTLSCTNNDETKSIVESEMIGKYKTEYIIHYSTYNGVRNIIYSDKEIYTCSFQGTNFLLEKDNAEEIVSTTAPIQIVKSEIIK